MRKKLILIISMLLIVFEFLSNVKTAYALDGEATKTSDNGSSYYFIHYNGDEQEIVLSDSVKLTLSDWGNKDKSTVKGKVIIHTNSSNQTRNIIMNASDELNEITVTENEKIHYRLASSDNFNVEKVKPLKLQDQVTVSTKNDNGTSIEEVQTIDEYGTVIEKKGLIYYSVDENNKKVEISAEEYNSLNEPKEEATDQNSSAKVEPLNLLTTQSMNPSINYASHVQGIGWMNPVTDGEMSGTEGQAKRLESIKITVHNGQDLGVKYSTHVQKYGWLAPVTNGQVSGTTGEGKRLEAIKIELTGKNAGKFDIFYRAHVEHYGWMDWVKNGEVAGTTGEAKRIEAIEIVIKQKEPAPPTNTNPNDPDLSPSINYRSHVQSYGWLDSVSNGEMSGTIDQAKRLEAFQISLDNLPYSGSVSYKSYVQDFGWQDSVSDGTTSGSTGENKRIEAIQVKLTGEIANHYDVYYRVYSQSFGWLDWAQNGESAGTSELSKRLEAVEITLVAKGGDSPGSTDKPFLTAPSIVYSTHVQTYGWLNNEVNGATSGTVGKGKRLEAIKVSLQDSPYSGGISYSTHVQGYGWIDNVSDGEVSGTSGESKRLEAIKINLTGDIGNYYDVYYRVHIQGNGWLGWAKNGMKAGSEGLAKRLEAIEIKLVPKGQGETVNEKTAFKQPFIVFLDPGHGGTDSGAVSGKYREKDLNLTVAKKVKSLLVNLGYNVIMSRNDDSTVELIDRPKMANDLQADIFVSIHTNATESGTTAASGIESYYYKYTPGYPPKINSAMHNDPVRIARSMTLANLLQQNMINYTGAVNRGTNGETLAVVRESAMPATLVELGFINNPSERQKLFTDAYQNKIAKAIADGINHYFSIY